MDQQMVSFRRIPEDDRAAGHMQREHDRDRQRKRGRHKQEKKKKKKRERSTPAEEFFLFVLSQGSALLSVIAKGQQLF